VVGQPLPRALHCETPGEDCLWDCVERLGACGDWCVGGRVEAAFLSGVALAGRVLGAAG
jgi:renalase